MLRTLPRPLRPAALALAGLVAACATQPNAAPPAVPLVPSQTADSKFAAFVKDFRANALAEGISAPAYDRAMTALKRNARVEEANLNQPEFSKPVWDYLDGAASADRIARGQEMLGAYATVLADIERRSGVRKEILVAIWGLESNYGRQMGNYNMFEALATLGYDGPRMAFGRKELIAALRMYERENYPLSQMTSSWAGAFGQTQFMPSTFLQHAVDGDGNGRKDLWNSAPDALASAANVLADAGWQRGEAWGFEIILPRGFAYEEADIDTRKTLSHWRRAGVLRANGVAIPDTQTEASIYLPAGLRGPAFMILPNFRAILRYNNAASYALAIAHLADRIAGGTAIWGTWPRYEQPLSRSDRIAFQTALKKLGYDIGDIDGVLGRKSRAALRAYQKAKDLPADGFATMDMLARATRDAR